MFDLFRSREKTVRYLLGGLLLLVAASMVITLVPGFGSGVATRRQGQIIAEIGDDELTATEVAEQIRREIRTARVTKEMAEYYVPSFVQQMIAERAASYQARRMGFQVTDTELAIAIRSMVPNLYDNGKFVGNDAYAAYLQQVNMTIPIFEQNVRKQILMTRIENLALEGIVVPPAEVELQYRMKFEKFKVSYFGVKQDEAMAQVKITPQEIKGYWERNKARFQRPATREFLMVVVDEEKIAALSQVDEGVLRAAYQAQLDRFRSEEGVKVRHILVKTQDKPKEEVDKLRKKIDGLLAQIKGGADFAELAKKNSDDPGSAANGGDLGLVTRGQTVPEFERAAFSLKPGESSGVISTMYGFHILKVEGKETARVKPFEEVRGQLAAEMAKEGVAERMRKVAEDARVALAKSPAEAERVAKSGGASFIKVDKGAASDPLPEVGTDMELGQAIFAVPVGGVTGVVELSEGKKLVVAKVLQQFPERPAEFVEVEAPVTSQAKAEVAARLMTEQLSAVAAKLASGTDFASTAKGIGTQLKSPPEFARGAPVEGLGVATPLEPLFSKNVGEYIGPIQMQGGSYFIKLLEKIPADMTMFAAERDQFQTNLKSRMARDRKELFSDGLLQALVKEGKVKIHEDAVKMLTQTFRN